MRHVSLPQFPPVCRPHVRLLRDAILSLHGSVRREIRPSLLRSRIARLQGMHESQETADACRQGQSGDGQNRGTIDATCRFARNACVFYSRANWIARSSRITRNMANINRIISAIAAISESSIKGHIRQFRLSPCRDDCIISLLSSK